VDCSGPGVSRRRRGRGFEYLDEHGRRVTDPQTLARIRELVIPPAWKNVWICPDPNGHLQATGIDAAGRKQYLYHERWRERRDQQKFTEMMEFARALPRMRRVVSRDLGGSDLSRERVLACAVRMLDWGFFRIGSEDYAEQNETFGLATMLKSHVKIEGEGLLFDYPAKGGQRRVQSIVDQDVREIVSDLKRRRGGGPELLAYRQGRRWRDLGSADVNEYLKSAAGGDFSAKDFRTWNATLLAAVSLAARSVDGSKGARQRVISEAVKAVAFFLGNTPAVCRSSYIDPRVFDRYLSGWTIGGALSRLDAPLELGDPKTRRRIEAAVLDLLEEEKRSPALEKI
jgi:DNA topoisomerase I